MGQRLQLHSPSMSKTLTTTVGGSPESGLTTRGPAPGWVEEGESKDGSGGLRQWIPTPPPPPPSLVKGYVKKSMEGQTLRMSTGVYSH